METDENLWKPMKDGQGYAYRTAMRLSAARRRPASVLSNFVSGAAKNESATVKKRPARRPQTGGASIPYHHPSKKPSMSSMGGLPSKSIEELHAYDDWCADQLSQDWQQCYFQCLPHLHHSSSSSSSSSSGWELGLLAPAKPPRGRSQRDGRRRHYAPLALGREGWQASYTAQAACLNGGLTAYHYGRPSGL